MLSDVKKNTLNLNGRLVLLNKPLIMGVLNLTPDSFYIGSRYNTEKEILTRVGQIIEEGGDIVDIGAQSTRPKAEKVTVEEELKRVKFALEIICREFQHIIISLDTFSSVIVNQMCSEYPVSLINDVTAGGADSEMYKTVLKFNIPYIIMHMQGTPSTMQDKPVYNNVVEDIIRFFAEKVSNLKKMGINDIIIDPGYGFGKTIEHNYQLMAGIENFRIFGLPICIGVSRKSMIYKVLETDPANSLNGTIALNTVALLKRADILRVHDVKEAVDVVKLLSKLL